LVKELSLTFGLNFIIFVPQNLSVYSMQLYNKLSAEERRLLIAEAGTERLTLSFYQYHQVENPQVFRDYLFLHWNEMDVLGRTYVAYEGINAQLSVPAPRFDDFKNFLNGISFLKAVRLNIAVEQDNESFLKLTVKFRDKIVADGLDDSTFDVTQKGIHLNALKFNTLLKDSDTICVDMRNHYESEIGHFKGALIPDVDTFRESLPLIEENLSEYKEDKKLLMYCTGGIRCEKASAYFKHKGFKNVFQLEGGIIEYARQVNENGLENKFIGKNFVFDERRRERISDDVIAQCHQCGTPCDSHVNCPNEACHLLFIQCDSCKEKRKGCCSYDCQKIVSLPIEEQRKRRKGEHNSNKIFKKGRSEILKYKH
tara:strand:- start:6500 stop:7606 length:1107 start_codon:yes stop_codon:yes gene_type:complete